MHLSLNMNTILRAEHEYYSEGRTLPLIGASGHHNQWSKYVQPHVAEGWRGVEPLRREVSHLLHSQFPSKRTACHTVMEDRADLPFASDNPQSSRSDGPL